MSDSPYFACPHCPKRFYFSFLRDQAFQRYREHVDTHHPDTADHDRAAGVWPRNGTAGSDPDTYPQGSDLATTTSATRPAAPSSAETRSGPTRLRRTTP